jgi:hypothetical protein
MRIQYASQMFKAAQKRPLGELIRPSAPVLILAGNCVQPWVPESRTFLRDLSLSFDKVYVVPGPAEYSSRPSVCYTKNLTELASLVYKFPNVALLDNKLYDACPKTTVIGTTLWHHMNGIAPPVYDMVGINARQQVDSSNTLLQMIRKRAVQNMFLEGRDFLRQALLDPENSTQDVVAATYHTPTFDLLTDEDKKDYNTAIMSNNELFYCTKPLRLWVAGTGRGFAAVRHDDVLFVKNAHGDAEEAAPMFRVDAIAELA